MPMATAGPDLDKRYHLPSICWSCATSTAKGIIGGGGSTLSSIFGTATSVLGSAGSSFVSDASKGASDLSSGASALASEASVLATEVASVVASLGPQVLADIKNFGEEVVQYSEEIETVIDNTANAIINDIENWSPSGSGNLNINLGPPSDKLVESPWGEAYQLFQYPSNKSKRSASKSSSSSTKSTKTTTTSSASPSSNISKSVKVYCVDCGVTGTTHYSGAAKFSIADGVSELNFAMNGTLKFGIGIGVDAEIKYTMPQLAFNLIPPQGVPILEIEGVIVIGPILELQATLNADVFAEGRVIAGSTITIPQFETNFDFVNTANSYVDGFDNLEITKYFAASGEIGASATVGMPFSIGVGITLPALKFDKEIKVVNTPSITANAAFEAQVSVGQGAPTASNLTDCPNGFNWDITFQDNLDLNIFGLYTRPLYTYQSPPLAQGCYQIPGTESQDRAVVKAVVTTTSATPSSTSGPFPSGFSSSGYTSSGMVSSNNQISNDPGSSIAYGTQLHDASGAISLVSGQDGNLYAVKAAVGTFFQRIIDTSTTWASVALQTSYISSQSLIVDDQNRAFFLFSDTLSAFSVSRIRALPIDEIPSNAFQSIMGYGDISGQGLVAYYFADPVSPLAAYYPVACTVTDAASQTLTQIFAVSDLHLGIGNLTSNSALQSTVTGGVVGSCSYLQLTGAYTPNPNPTNPVVKFIQEVTEHGLGSIFGGGSTTSSSTSGITNPIVPISGGGGSLVQQIFGGIF